MAKFKLGDKLRKISGSCGNCKNSDYFTPTSFREGGTIYHYQGWKNDGSLDGSCFDCLSDENFELLEGKKSIMSNLKEKFVQLFLSEPEKSFRKAGITDGDGILTSDGQQIFLTWLLKKNGEVFKTEVVDTLVAEEKESK